VGENEVLPDYTVVYGSGLRRVDSSGVEELKTQMIRRQVETLKKLIPTNPAKHQS
jgi:dynactin-6